ncbi:MAG TPA: helix-turn-helix transcriptional regulator [Thermomicrobiales bacterium]|nr:helix-turn-helix transcriptional regulator [Thermomicrobiales bacterium]
MYLRDQGTGDGRGAAEHDLSQTGIACRLGASQPAVARLETGDHVPTLATLIRVSDALDIEFLVDVSPKTRRSGWVSSEAYEACVVERATTARGGKVLVAVS